MWFNDDQTGSILPDMSPVTGLAFTESVIEISRSSEATDLKHPIQAAIITPLSHDTNSGILTYSITSASGLGPVLTLDDATNPDFIIISSLAAEGDATHEYDITI